VFLFFDVGCFVLNSDFNKINW